MLDRKLHQSDLRERPLTWSTTVGLLVSMVVIHCVFHQLTSQGVEILLVKMAVGGVTQTKTKLDILTRNTQNTITGCFSEKQECEHNMFPKYLQTYYGISML